MEVIILGVKVISNNASRGLKRPAGTKLPTIHIFIPQPISGIALDPINFAVRNLMKY